MEESLPQFSRKRIVLESHSALSSTKPSRITVGDKPCVLVINSSNEMAQSITRQLLIALPHCSIMYSPSLELAAWMLKRKPIKLIISSEVLPDGGPTKLQSIVRKLPNPPDVVIVGKSLHRSVSALRDAGYKLVSRKKIGSEDKRAAAPIRQLASHQPTPPPAVQTKLSTLGADLRNDLNNPLQEIVTLAFVVKSSTKNEITEDAIQAIERAAKQMAGTVDGLEERIRSAVEKPIT